MHSTTPSTPEPAGQLNITTGNTTTAAVNNAPKSRFTDAAIDDIFSYHAPTPEQLEQYNAVRAGAREFARILRDNTPPSADQTTAIRMLRECVATANASIALDGKF